jgi:hypothetical protein
MSSSIKDSTKQAADIARVQADLDKENQRAQDKQNLERADFSRIMEKKDESRRLQSSRQEKHQAQEQEQKKDQQSAAQKRQQEARQQSKRPSNRAHHASKQARMLHQQLDTRHKESSALKNDQSLARKDGMQETKDAAEDRKLDLDEQDSQSIDQKDNRKASRGEHDLTEGPIDPDQRQGQQQSEERQEDGSHPGGQQGAAAAEGSAKSSGSSKTIPAEIIAYLVRAIFVGINEEGLKTMRIELKGAGLDGGILDIKADGGKIFLHFKDLDDNTERLLQSSKGPLMGKLEAKGLALEEMKVERKNDS